MSVRRMPSQTTVLPYSSLFFAMKRPFFLRKYLGWIAVARAEKLLEIVSEIFGPRASSMLEH